MNTRPCLTLLFAALLVPRAASAEVWEVGAGGLATIDDAIALASDGDIVLVHAGTYPGFTVTAKSLVIVADAGATPNVYGNIVVQDLAAAQSVTLQGLKVSGDQDDFAVRATLNNGALWIDDCVVKAGIYGGVALEADQCTSVVLRRSTFQGGTGYKLSSPGGEGVALRNSTAVLFLCSITGGSGGFGGDGYKDCTEEEGGPGGNGMLAENSMVLLQASALKGGTGGAGDICICCSPTYCGNGGPGGPGILAIGPTKVTLVESSLTGGDGGWAEGCCCSVGPKGDDAQLIGGILIDLPEVPRALEAGSPLREGQLATIVASGAPRELMAIYASYGPTLITLPSVYGSGLLQPPLLFAGAAFLPNDGKLQLQAPVPELGASVEGLSLCLQAVSLPASGGFVLGEAATLVLLDAAF